MSVSKGMAFLADPARASEYTRAVRGLRKPLRVRFAGATFVAEGNPDVAEFYARAREYGLECYADATGALCVRSIAEGNLALERVDSERAARDAERRRDADRWHREVLALRAQQGLCVRDTQCLRRIGHDGKCVHDVRSLAALGEPILSNAAVPAEIRNAS